MATIVIVGLALTLALTPCIRALAIRTGFVSQPVARSMHSKPQPLLGGVAIYIAFTASVVVGGGLKDHIVVGILIGGALIVLLGAIDDKINIRPKTKLLGQLLVATLVVYRFGISVKFISNPFGGGLLPLGHLAGPLTIMWMVTLVNAFNLIDGLDGLAAGIASIASLTLLVVSLRQGMHVSALLTAALASTTFAFLRYNMNPAKIFLGDAGSMFIGYMLAAISITGMLKTTLTIGMIVPLLASALPVLDTAFAIIRRLANHRSIGQADKDHIHHRLLRLGLSHKQTVYVMWVISAVLGLSAVLVTLVPAFQALLLSAGVTGVTVVGLGRLGLLRIDVSPESKSLRRQG